MGLFDFLKKKREPEVKVEVKVPAHTPSKASVSDDPYNHGDALKTTFYKEFGAIPEFTKAELDAMYRIVSADTSYMDMGRYFKPHFDQYFFGRKWTWVEYEKWLAIFNKIGKYPVRWVTFKTEFDEGLNVLATISNLKVAELKALITFLNLEAPAKAKKADLIKVISDSPLYEKRLATHPILIVIHEQKKSSIGYSKYSAFMHHVCFRTKSLSDRLKAESLGMKRSELIHIFEEDKPFSKIALKEDPNALTPLYPSDGTIWINKIDF